jgi:hypothetical protein
MFRKTSYNYWQVYEEINYLEPMTVTDYYFLGFRIWRTETLCSDYEWIQENPHA